MLLLLPGCLALLVHITQGYPGPDNTKPYAGHKVLELFPKTEHNYGKLMEMEMQYELDFWKDPKHMNDSVNVRVPSEHVDNFIQKVKLLDIASDILIDDVAELLADIEHRNTNVQKRAIFSYGSGMNHDTFNTFDTIMNFLKTVEADVGKSSGVTAETHSIGFSHEGREIAVIKISSSSGDANKRGIFLDGGIHAREWISPASVCYLIEEFAYNPSGADDVPNVLERYDVYLLPVLNPDGYVYTSTDERLWRKNRRNNANSNCLGVDLNRNFPFQWNPSIGGSVNPCSDTYSGEAAASEPETEALVSYLTHLGGSLDAYLTIHSYGQYWLYPWGYTSDYPADRADLHNCANHGVRAIEAERGTEYQLGSSTNELYAAAGGSDDFAKGQAGIKYSYTIELPDTGRYGFVLPESEIQPVCEEFREGLFAFISAMHTLENGRNGRGL